MSDTPQTQPPGWYYAEGDPPGTQRYWDGMKWEGGPQPVPGTDQGMPQPGGVPGLAEPVMRIAARFIDYIVWFVIVMVFAVIFIGSLAVGGNVDDVSFVATFLAGLLATSAITAYETVLVGMKGQTLGKMALGLKVVRVDGSPADMKDGFMRILPYFALGVLAAIIPILPQLISFIIGVVSLIFLFTDANRQTVWDKVAKTLVVSTK